MFVHIQTPVCVTSVQNPCHILSRTHYHVVKAQELYPSFGYPCRKDEVTMIGRNIVFGDALEVGTMLSKDKQFRRGPFRALSIQCDWLGLI